MCTTSKTKQIQILANEYLNKDFEFKGTTYNLAKLGWTFRFGTYKTAFGRCTIKRGLYKQISVGKFMIQHSDTTLEKFEDTIAHECAHAIQWEASGRLSHDWEWKQICGITGADPTPCHSANVDATASKYKLVCNNCGKESPSHKKLKVKYACASCCKKHNGGKYSNKYVLTQVLNSKTSSLKINNF